MLIETMPCPPDEHSRIVEAIAESNGATAAQEMLHHLMHVEKDMNLDKAAPERSFSDAMGWLRGKSDDG